MKLYFEIAKDGQITKENLDKWNIEPLNNWKTLQSLPNNLFGLLGERIGENLLKQDFFIDKKQIDWPRRMTRSQIHLQKEKMGH